MTKDENQAKSRTIFDVFSTDIISHITSGVKKRMFFNEELRITFNRVLDKMFKIKTSKIDKIYWDYPKTVIDCDYDFIFHFIEAKLCISKKEELVKDQKLIILLKNAYEEHRQFYTNKEELEPRDNRWTKLIIIMNWLDLLSKEEKEFWIKKYACYKYSETEPKLPQAWNRVWALTEGLGILNVDDLKKIKTINFSEAEERICSYVPDVQDIFEQNVFNERDTVMLNKYVLIRKFCNKPFFKEIECLLD